MKFKTFEPRESLKPFIKYYWILEQSNADEQLKSERVVPAGYLQLFFHYKTPFKDASGTKPKSYFCGQLTKYHDVMPMANTGMLAVVFYPFSAKAFTHYPVNELTNKSVDLKLIYGDKAKRLEETLEKTESFTEKIQRVEEFLQQQFFISNKYQYGLIKQAVNSIDEAKGMITINEVADAVALGQRHFERVFKSTVGISPKIYAQVVRFYHALQNMNSEKNLTEICFRFGYFDQSHFIKTFKRFTGMRPKDYFSHNCNSLEEME